jgi:hypothetical protein
MIFMIYMIIVIGKRAVRGTVIVGEAAGLCLVREQLQGGKGQLGSADAPPLAFLDEVERQREN